METKFFKGNYLIALGQPYLIISTKENKNDLLAEKILIFVGNDVQQFIKFSTVRLPKYSDLTINEFVLSEIQVSKDDIYYDILQKEYSNDLEKRNFNVTVDFEETNQLILILLKQKSPDILEKIKNKTINESLKSLIALHQSIIIERNDFIIS